MSQIQVKKGLSLTMFTLEGILFVIVAFQLFFTNGESTILYIDSTFPNYIDFSNVSFVLGFNNISIDAVQSEDSIGQIMQYRINLVKQNFRIPYIQLFMYWVLFPIVCWSYVIYSFKKVSPQMIDGLDN